jgi:hypothetical protein
MSLLFVLLLWGVYVLVLHPWLIDWGATSQERGAQLPGDELAPGPYSTRAISIDASSASVWPWLVQMGQDRAGFYSNAWLENLVTADIHNADVIHPDWQQRAVGDKVPLARPGLANLEGSHGRIGYVEIVLLEHQHAIANIPARFVLVRDGDQRTRLLLREPIESQGPAFVRWLVWDPMHFVMVQRMLRGIKERAEAKALVPSWLARSAHLGWILAMLSAAAVLLSNRRWRRWCVLPIATAAPALLITGDENAALAGFLATSITILGALAMGQRWWPPFFALAACVLIVLLVAPDAYVAFGLWFLAAALTAAVATATKSIHKSIEETLGSGSTRR